MTEGEFLEKMRERGFVVVPTRPKAEWEFTHPGTGSRRYIMWEHERPQYLFALSRMTGERNAGTGGAA